MPHSQMVLVRLIIEQKVSISVCTGICTRCFPAHIAHVLKIIKGKKSIIVGVIRTIPILHYCTCRNNIKSCENELNLFIEFAAYYPKSNVKTLYCCTYDIQTNLKTETVFFRAVPSLDSIYFLCH